MGVPFSDTVQFKESSQELVSMPQCYHVLSSDRIISDPTI